MYTLQGSYAEAVTFLEAYESGFMKAYLGSDIEEHFYFQDIKKYQLFKNWLSQKSGLNYKDTLMLLIEQHQNPFDAALKLYREFKSNL